MADEGDSRNRPIASNRRARRDYEILDTLECGIALSGSEVKSLREAKVQLADGFARFRDGELWLYNVHIAPYSHSDTQQALDAERPRKLLAHRHQLDRLRSRVSQDKLTLVPLRVYFSDGRAKVEMALARGRRSHDKRQALAKRDADREVRRALARDRRNPS